MVLIKPPPDYKAQFPAGQEIPKTYVCYQMTVFCSFSAELVNDFVQEIYSLDCSTKESGESKQFSCLHSSLHMTPTQSSQTTFSFETRPKKGNWD